MKPSLLIVFVIIIMLSILYIFNVKKKRKSKLSIYSWMKMTKSSRKIYDQEEILATLERKKRLINLTRKEYINYKKSKNN